MQIMDDKFKEDNGYSNLVEAELKAPNPSARELATLHAPMEAYSLCSEGGAYLCVCLGRRRMNRVMGAGGW